MPRERRKKGREKKKRTATTTIRASFSRVRFELLLVLLEGGGEGGRGENILSKGWRGEKRKIVGRDVSGDFSLNNLL